MWNKSDYNKVFVLIISILLGFLIIAGARSFQSIDELFSRDNDSNVFQEIQIMKTKNEDLEEEVNQLTLLLEQFTDQNQALTAIQEEIVKYQKLSGEKSIYGPGLEIIITGEITTPWVVDIINQIFAAGSQAMSINGIRLLNETVGFDTLPQGQILLNGSILTSPFTFQAIGETSVMEDILTLPGGIFDRLEEAFPEIILEMNKKEIIQLS